MTSTFVFIIMLIALAVVTIRRVVARYLSEGLADVRRRVAVARLRPRVFEPIDPNLLYVCELALDGCEEVARWREDAAHAMYLCDSCYRFVTC
jgi:hypothetical protein